MEHTSARQRLLTHVRFFGNVLVDDRWVWRHFEYHIKENLDIKEQTESKFVETIIDEDSNVSFTFEYASFPLTSNTKPGLMQRLPIVLSTKFDLSLESYSIQKELYLFTTELDHKLNRFTQNYSQDSTLKSIVEFVTLGYALSDILSTLQNADDERGTLEPLEEAITWYFKNVPLHEIHLQSVKSCLKSLSKLEGSSINIPKILGIAFARIDYELHPRVKRMKQSSWQIPLDSSAVSELKSSRSYATWKYLQRMGLRYYKEIRNDANRSNAPKLPADVFLESYFEVLSSLLKPNKNLSDSVFRESLLLTNDFIDLYLDFAIGPNSPFGYYGYYRHNSGIKAVPHDLCGSLVFVSMLQEKSLTLQNEVLERFKKQRMIAENDLLAIKDKVFDSEWLKQQELQTLRERIKEYSTPLANHEYLSAEFRWCDDCFTTALKSNSKILYEAAVTELTNNPSEWQTAKLSFSLETFSEMVSAINQNGQWSGGLGLFVNYRAHNFNSVAIMQQYFANKDASNLSLFEEVLYFIHFTTLPLGYSRKAIHNFEYNFKDSDIHHHDFLNMVQDESRARDSLERVLSHAINAKVLDFIRLLFKSDWSRLLDTRCLLKSLFSVIIKKATLTNEQWALLNDWLQHLLSPISLLEEEFHSAAFEVLEFLLNESATRELGCVLDLAKRLPLEDRLISILQTHRTLLLEIANTSTVKLMEVAAKSTLEDHELEKIAELLKGRFNLNQGEEVKLLRQNSDALVYLVPTMTKLAAIQNRLTSEPYNAILTTLLSCSLTLISKNFRSGDDENRFEIDTRIIELIETKVDIFLEYLEVYFAEAVHDLSSELRDPLILVNLIETAIRVELSDETVYKLFHFFALSQHQSTQDMSLIIVQKLQNGLMENLLKNSLVYDRMIEISMNSKFNINDLIFAQIVKAVVGEHSRLKQLLAPELIKNYASVVVFLSHPYDLWSCDCDRDWRTYRHDMPFTVSQFDQLEIDHTQLFDFMSELIDTSLNIRGYVLRIRTKDLLIIIKHLSEIRGMNDRDLMSELLSKISTNHHDLYTTLTNFPVEFFLICCTSEKLPAHLKSSIYNIMLENIHTYGNETVQLFFEIFTNEIDAFDYKSTVRLIYSSNTTVQTEMIKLLKNFGKINLWIMFMAESVSPTLMNAAEDFIRDSKDSKAYEGYVLALLDSSIKQTRELAFKILESSSFPLDHKSVLIKLAEHPSPDIWGYVMDNFGSLVSEDAASTFIQNVLLTRRVGRKTKLALQAYLEQHGINATIENTMKRLSSNGTNPDREFALRMLAFFGQESESISVAKVWENV